MAKDLNDDLLDLDLDYIHDHCDKMTFCSAQPTTYTEGNLTYALADVAMAPADFIVQAHSPDGRELVIAAKAGILIDTGGTALFVALLNTTGSELLAVTTCTSQLLTGGLYFNSPSWKIINRDPI